MFVGSAASGGPVKHPVTPLQQSSPGILAVVAVDAEMMQDCEFCAVGSNTENRANSVAPARDGRAVERTVVSHDERSPALGSAPIGVTEVLNGLQNRLPMTGRRQPE